jgi:hypothetical protein
MDLSKNDVTIYIYISMDETANWRTHREHFRVLRQYLTWCVLWIGTVGLLGLRLMAFHKKANTQVQKITRIEKHLMFLAAMLWVEACTCISSILYNQYCTPTWNYTASSADLPFVPERTSPMVVLKRLSLGWSFEIIWGSKHCFFVC